MGCSGELFARWEALINVAIGWYLRLLDVVMRRRLLAVASAVVLLVAVVVGLGSQLRREFFPEVDAGAFEIYVRAKSGTRIEETEKRVAEVEKVVAHKIGDDLELLISEIGVVADWSAAYTPNAGPMDAVVKVQLEERQAALGPGVRADAPRGIRADARVLDDLEFAFDAGGMIRSAMNEGKSTPINVRITGKNLAKAHQVAEAIQREVVKINGVVDCRILQRLDYPEYIIDVDRAKAADLGLTPDGRDAEPRGRPELQHPVQQEELLDRPGQSQPVLRRRAVSRGGHHSRSIPSWTCRSPATRRRSRSRCATWSTVRRTPRCPRKSRTPTSSPPST